MKSIWIISLLWLGNSLLFAQTFRHYDYLGGGHQTEVTVTTSSNRNGVTGQTTVDGFAINNDEQLKAAGRFLAQATMGTDWAMLNQTAAMGYDAWLNEQFALPVTSATAMLNIHAQRYAQPGDENPTGGKYQFMSAWMESQLTAPDLLRQRVGYGLSQHFVFSHNGSDLFEDFGLFSSHYYDHLLNNAFGDFQQLLTDVTLSGSMGLFLSHYANPKENLALNIRPDENYAREIMQLFSIGLWELEQNGLRKRDANGDFIPTYDNDDIKEFAQVFTGLSNGSPGGSFARGDLEDNANQIAQYPMRMYEEQHDNSTKVLLNGTVLPANQSGMDDINQTIDHLGNHPNAAPFFASALIKRLTTSNPSPSYIQRVAATFEPSQTNNLQQVIRAILLDPEARTCTPTESYTFGKLREPLVRLTNYLRALPLSADPQGGYPFDFYCYGGQTGQEPLGAPSVFNFYRPDYQPQGAISQNYLEAPEFQILNSTNSIGLVNHTDILTIRREYFIGCYEEAPGAEDTDVWEEDFFMNYTFLTSVINNPDELLRRIDLLYANGNLTDDTKTIIKNAINPLEEPIDKLRMALYLTMISPDYVIQK